MQKRVTEHNNRENEIKSILPVSNEKKTNLPKPYRQLFDNIVGYDDVKMLFNLSFSSEKPVHILLVGPPASAKTLFMLECIKLERSYFTLGSHIQSQE